MRCGVTLGVYRVAKGNRIAGENGALVFFAEAGKIQSRVRRLSKRSHKVGVSGQ
jgi:hypothetical protein